VPLNHSKPDIRESPIKEVANEYAITDHKENNQELKIKDEELSEEDEWFISDDRGQQCIF
jgi:hypothetical protein